MYDKLSELIKKHIAVIIIVVAVIEIIELFCLIGLTVSKNSLKRDYESTKRDYNDTKQDYLDYKKEIKGLINSTPTPIPTETPEPTPQPTVAPTPELTPQPKQNTQTSSGSAYQNGYVTTNTLSLEKYNKLQNGMSYEQVANILGSKGNLVSSSDIAGITTLSYGWYGQYGVPMVGVVFQNGKAASMYQIGLN